MRVFLCSYNGFTLAIPIRFVSSIMLCKDKIKSITYFDEENRSTFISLPFLFDCPSLDIRHGIILKDKNPGENVSDNSIHEKTVLLSTEIESETEIPDDMIYPIPRTLSAFYSLNIFNGILFNLFSRSESADNLILLLNPDFLIQYIKKEKQND